MAKRPGVMIYFDLLDSIEEYTYEERGQLLTAILAYGDTGISPNFQDRGLRTLWNGTKSKIDRDGVHYNKTVIKRRYAAYCKHQTEDGKEPIVFDEWIKTQKIDSVLEFDDES